MEAADVEGLAQLGAGEALGEDRLDPGDPQEVRGEGLSRAEVAAGAERARTVAAATMDRVREAVGLLAAGV
mgnify:CR=1 FL=1